MTAAQGGAMLLPLALGPVSAVVGLPAVFGSKVGMLAGSTALAYRLPDGRISPAPPHIAGPATDRRAGSAAGG